MSSGPRRMDERGYTPHELAYLRNPWDNDEHVDHEEDRREGRKPLRFEEANLDFER